MAAIAAATAEEAEPPPVVLGPWRVGRRRGRRDGVDDARQWAPKWRRLLLSSEEDGGPPSSYDEFDRVVRGMLNRVSTENACRLLPLDPSLRSIGSGTAGDSPPWWTARFAALMLTWLLQVIHTNRCARGLAMRSADNILPAYLDAVSPLLARSPRLVDSVSAWMSRLLKVDGLCWPTVRLLLLASRERRDRSTLPAHSLGRLPAELLKGRVLNFLVPPGLPTTATEGGQASPAGLCECWDSEDGRRDAAAVLAHVLLFAPTPAWPRLSAFAFCVAEAALVGTPGTCSENRVYLGASVLVAVAQRLDAPVSSLESGVRATESEMQARRKQRAEDVAILEPIVNVLRGHTVCEEEAAEKLSPFVRSRALAAVERAERTIENFRKRNHD